MRPRVVDLRSDTVTHPTDAMRQAMAAAEVGDDVYGEDPTVNRLQERASHLLGKEAALFVPTGTMANQVALYVQASRGSEVLAERESHIVLYECAGAAVVAGAQLRMLEGARGVFTPTQVVQALRDPTDPHEPRTSLVCLENTHNHAGGTVWTRQQTRAVAKAAHEHGLKVHVDGARLFNSAVGQDVPARSLVDAVDSVMFCLSKGLSAPVGSLVAGTSEFVAEALRARKLFGGGMRQAGVIAAAGLVALDSMVDRLAQDHANCRRLAAGLAQVPGIAIDLDTVQTNILFTDVAGTGHDARKLVASLEKAGVRAAAPDDRRIRFVTHRHVTREDVDWVIGQVRATVAGKALRARP